MPKGHLNLTAFAWRQLQRSWQPRLSADLFRQRWMAGPVLSLARRIQDISAGPARNQVSLSGSLFIVGYWRSGTTLLHEYLSRDARFTVPTTHACMNPQTFLLAPATKYSAVKARPMDAMLVRPDSPAEDEFGLLGLGARSPYEALLFPSHLDEALQLADPRDLDAVEREQWQSVFLEFLRGVSWAGGGRPVLAKSPMHGYRLATIGALVPSARFVLIHRDPYRNLESVVRMWREMMSLYGLVSPPHDDVLRGIVLADRMRFEAKLADGIKSVSAGNVVSLRYENLVADPLRAIREMYGGLGWDIPAGVEAAISDDHQHRKSYIAVGSLPPKPWRQRIATEWAPIFERYGYDGSPPPVA